MVALHRLLFLLIAAAAGVHGAAVPEKAPDGDLEALACYNNPYTGFCEYCGSSGGFDAVVSVRCALGPPFAPARSRLRRLTYISTAAGRPHAQDREKM